MSYGTSNPVRYFGQQVRRARRAAGWTLAEFGQRIGYDPGQISRIENGKRPPTELFAQMCDRAFPDRYGWFGVEQVAFSWPRVLGIALLVAGAALTLRR
jgi:transcriptional regulator with XRE-family HTH domain